MERGLIPRRVLSCTFLYDRDFTDPLQHSRGITRFAHLDQVTVHNLLIGVTMDNRREFLEFECDSLRLKTIDGHGRDQSMTWEVPNEKASLLFDSIQRIGRLSFINTAPNRIAHVSPYFDGYLGNGARLMRQPYWMKISNFLGNVTQIDSLNLQGLLVHQIFSYQWKFKTDLDLHCKTAQFHFSIRDRLCRYSTREDHCAEGAKIITMRVLTEKPESFAFLTNTVAKRDSEIRIEAIAFLSRHSSVAYEKFNESKEALLNCRIWKLAEASPNFLCELPKFDYFFPGVIYLQKCFYSTKIETEKEKVIRQLMLAVLTFPILTGSGSSRMKYLTCIHQSDHPLGFD